MLSMIDGTMTFTEEMPIWFSDFANAIQQDLLGLHVEIGVMRTEMQLCVPRWRPSEILLICVRRKNLVRFVTHSELQSSVDMLRDEILEETSKVRYAKEIDALRSRTNRIEGKLGIRQNQSAS